MVVRSAVTSQLRHSFNRVYRHEAQVKHIHMDTWTIAWARYVHGKLNWRVFSVITYLCLRRKNIIANDDIILCPFLVQ